MNMHDIVLTIITFIVLVREAPRAWRWLLAFLLPPKKTGGDVILRPGRGVDGFSNGRVLIQNAAGKNVLVVWDEGVEVWQKD